jgi:hypothetical protein
MAEKGRLSVEQRIKSALFFTETRSVVVTLRRFHAHFQVQWAPSFKTIHKLYNQFSVGEETSPVFICAFCREQLMLLECAGKKPQ